MYYQTVVFFLSLHGAALHTAEVCPRRSLDPLSHSRDVAEDGRPESASAVAVVTQHAVQLPNTLALSDTH